MEDAATPPDEACEPCLPIRLMQPADVPHCIWLRTQTTENHWSLQGLHKVGINEESVIQRLATTHRGWVREQGGQIVGFSMADRSNGELWVVAVLPNYEGQGIGTQLVKSAQQWLHESGWPEIWLWTSPNKSTRAYALYRRLGWRDCGVKDHQLIMQHI
ncbi:MAG TPA: GNAT family N-acetyltransferase [Tepidisphaeraceae bacterium]|nr:GNAT family N-acetyltransferase [Tepidisphaeraceae bacterium]